MHTIILPIPIPDQKAESCAISLSKFISINKIGNIPLGVDVLL